MMSRLSTFFFLVLISVISGCSLYDLRPEIMTKESFTEANQARAKELISQSASYHGWDSISESNITTTYSDEWPGFFMRTFFRPWPSNSVDLKHSFGTKDLFTSSVELLDGKNKGEIWGLENNKAYKIKDGKKEFMKNDDISFYLPAYQYFIQLSVWSQDIPLVAYIGEQKVKNTNYHVVFGSWNTFEPQKEVDQYLFYFEKKTKRLDIVAYTIRDAMASAHGANFYSDFRKVDGLRIPFKQTITEDVDSDDVVHVLTMSDFSLD